MQSFSIPKKFKLDSTYYIIMKIFNKTEKKNSANHSADIDYKDFMNIYRKCTDKPYYFLTIDTTLPTNNSKKNLQIHYKNGIT